MYRSSQRIIQVGYRDIHFLTPNTQGAAFMRFTIKFKLALAFGLMIVMSAAMSTLAIVKLSSLNSAISVIVEGPPRIFATRAIWPLCSTRSAWKRTRPQHDSQAIQGFVEQVKQTGRRLSKLPTRSKAHAKSGCPRQNEGVRRAYKKWALLDDQILKWGIENTSDSNARLPNCRWAKPARCPPTCEGAFGGKMR